jgi:hypothetical protein
MFGHWTNQVGGKLKQHLLAGASAFCRAIRLSRNDIVFDKAPIKSSLQVLYRGMHWLRFWSQLERHDQERSQSTLVAASLKRWLCRFMLIMDGDLAIGCVLSISSSKLVVA